MIRNYYNYKYNYYNFIIIKFALNGLTLKVDDSKDSD